MSPANLPVYVKTLRQYRPPWLHGYPSALAMLAGFLVETGLDLGYQVNWITIGAETLLPHQSDRITQAFGIAPKQHYGMAEAVANISQCDHGSLHVDEDFAAVEFVPNPDGITHQVVGTNLSNLATPLLRYKMQDRVVLADGGCLCGRPGRIVHSIEGRQDDYVILKNGARLGRLCRLFENMVHIREAQVWQQVPGEIVLRVVRAPTYREQDEILLLQEARQRLGADIIVHLQYLESLPRTDTGKFRIVVSDLPDGQISPG